MSNMYEWDVRGFGNELFICWCGLSATDVPFYWPLPANVDNQDYIIT